MPLESVNKFFILMVAAEIFHELMSKLNELVPANIFSKFWAFPTSQLDRGELKSFAFSNIRARSAALLTSQLEISALKRTASSNMDLNVVPLDTSQEEIPPATKALAPLKAD
jgi:hypothetical protein